jgi:hypothetical protein
MRLKPTNEYANMRIYYTTIIVNFLHVAVTVCSHFQEGAAQSIYYTDNQINVYIVMVIKYSLRWDNWHQPFNTTA